MNEDVQHKIDELSRTVNLQNERIVALENKPIQLDRLLDNSSKDVIESIVSNRILNIIWDDYFYYFSSFESIERYLTSATGAVQTVDSTGLVMTTNGTGANETDFLLKFPSSSLVSINKEARFRIENQVSSVTNVSWLALTLENSAATHYVGFQMTNGNINGLSKDGTTEKSILLGTYSANTKVILELRFYPGSKVIFYINGIEKGTITTNLPTATPERMFDVGIGETSASARTSITTFFEFIQKK